MSTPYFLCDAHEHLQHDQPQFKQQHNQSQFRQMGRFLDEERYVMMIFGYGMGLSSSPVIFSSRLYPDTIDEIEQAAAVQRKLLHDMSAVYELTVPSQFAVYRLNETVPREIRTDLRHNRFSICYIEHGGETHGCLEQSRMFTRVRTASFRNSCTHLRAVDVDGKAFYSVEINVLWILEQLKRFIREHQ